jgi:glycosyltransferase involved in cell wall biosynthesis
VTNSFTHSISIVVPVYKGEEVISPLVEEISLVFNSTGVEFVTPNGHRAAITEVILVHDGGMDNSATVMRALEKRFDFVRCVWLSRNFGQHAATLAGIAASQGDWIVTIDEDGQQNPAYISNFLDRAIETNSQVVYARPTNKPPHGFIRNSFSKLAKGISKKILAGAEFESFNSFRLILGEPARALSAYGGTGIYLDAALMWVTSSATTCDVELRSEDRSSSYTFGSLLSHFGRLVVTAGARPLRIIALLGMLVATGGFLLAMYIVWMKFTGGIPAAGWASVIVAVLVTSGLTMLSLGVISEFLGAAVRSSMGKPLYLVVSDPINGPLRENVNKSVERHN